MALLVIGFINPKKSLFWDKKGPTKKKSAFVYSGFMILFFILFGVTSDSKTVSKLSDKTSETEKTDVSDKPKEEEKKIDMPAEQKLAVLDANTFVDTTDIKVIRMKTLLNDLASDYEQSRDTIADYTSRAQGVLHDRGIQENCLNILEEMHKAGKIENTSYKEAVTLYVMLRDKQ